MFINDTKTEIKAENSGLPVFVCMFFLDHDCACSRQRKGRFKKDSIPDLFLPTVSTRCLRMTVRNELKSIT